MFEIRLLSKSRLLEIHEKISKRESSALLQDTLLMMFHFDQEVKMH